MRVLPIVWCLLSAWLLCVRSEDSGSSRNPRVIRLTFRNETGAPANLPDRLLPASASTRGNAPLVFCRDAEYPDDILCDVGMLIEQDVYPANMKMFGADTAIRDPVRMGKFCKLEFLNFDEDMSKPMRFNEIICGMDREIISEESVNLPQGIDSMAVLPRFKVANMDDIVVSSYDSGFGCKHRLKRYRARGRSTKKPVRGSFFRLDSFFCSIGFGVAEGRPETPYPPQVYYKYDRKRWRPSGNFPDYL